MAETTGISWADATVNFWIGCTKVSAACDFCYAERDWSTKGRHKRVEWGPHGARSPTKDPIAQMQRLQRKAVKEARRLRVFINSLSDWADNHRSITPEMRGAIFDGAKLCPDLDVMLLTKRPQNIARYLPDDWGSGYPNVWLATTVENQGEADRRIGHLLEVPATLHFVSVEPMLGRVDLRAVEIGSTGICFDALTGRCVDAGFDYAHTIKWVICGGESGPKARPMHLDWARALCQQCYEAGVPFHFKQHGEWGPDQFDLDDGKPSVWVSPDGAVIDGGFVEIGEVDCEKPVSLSVRYGTKATGRLLDGRLHDAMPVTP